MLQKNPVMLLRFQLINPASRTLQMQQKRMHCLQQKHISACSCTPLSQLNYTKLVPRCGPCCEISAISRWTNMSQQRKGIAAVYWWALQFDSKSANLSFICEERKISIPCSAGEIACVAKITAELREHRGWSMGEKPADAHTSGWVYHTHDLVGSSKRKCKQCPNSYIYAI